MTPPRSQWLSCLPLLLISIPLIAQRPGNPAAVSRTIPEGTTFLIRLQDKLDTKKLEQGKHFKAKLAEDLIASDGSTIPRGKKIKGHLSSIQQGLHARMLLSFDEIETNRWIHSADRHRHRSPGR